MRVIRKTASSSSREIVDLLSSLFAIELLNPSRCLWLTSPWITDLPLIDNRFGGFPDVDSVGRRVVTLSELLVALASRGSHVVVATRDDSINEPFLARLNLLTEVRRVTGNVTVRVVPPEQRFHDKALAADDFVVAGSMNFTFAGALLNEEHVELHTDGAYVAQTQKDLFQRFGGVLA